VSEPLAIGVVYMKFYVDTAQVGVTANPTFLDDLAKTGQSIL